MDEREDAERAAYAAGEKTLRYYINSNHDFSVEYMAMGTVQDALRAYCEGLKATATLSPAEPSPESREGEAA